MRREIARHAEARAAREREREAAAARLAEARREAAREREELAHEAELLRLERETQRARVGAERTRAASLRGARASLQGARAGGAGGAGAGGGTGSAAGPGAASGAAGAAGGKTAAAPTDKRNNSAGGAVSSSKKAAAKPGKRNPGKGKPDKEKPGIITPATPHGSTLLLVAQAAAKGDARGITGALQAVPQGEQRGQTSHALAVAIGEPAYEWFSPGSGGESSPVGPPTQRTAQALDLMASGGWVKARAILVAVVQQRTGTERGGRSDGPDPPAGAEPNKPLDPFAVYALALCDHRVAGTRLTAAKQQLDGLDAADSDLWPGPPDGRPTPDARAFPLGALVRAHLLAASSDQSSPPPPQPPPQPKQQQQQLDAEDGAGGGKETPDPDPRATACSLAVSFLRAPVHARKVGKVNSPAWIAAAEALVKENGWALARELWGPEGSGSGDSGGKGGALASGDGDYDEGVVGQWQRLQAKFAVSSDGMDELLEMSGLDAIKADFLSVAKLTVINKERGYDPASGSFNIRLEGNPGTGESLCFSHRQVSRE